MRSLKTIGAAGLLACSLFFAPAAVCEGAAQAALPVPPGEGREIHEWETPAGAELRAERGREVSETLFGRQEINMKAAVVDPQTGAEVPPERLFADVEAAQAFLNAYAEENVLPALNTYLDRSDVLPVPMDNVYFGPAGVTFHYDSAVFSYFSGNGGAIELKYYELAAFLTPDALAARQPGLLCAFPDARPGESLRGALERLGALNEPDFITDGELYEVEDASFRGAHLIAPRGAEGDESALITAVRVTRIDLDGLITGLSTRVDCRGLLGAPDATGALDMDDAQNLRLSPGAYDRYLAPEGLEGCTLTLYFDETELFYAAELSR